MTINIRDTTAHVFSGTEIWVVALFENSSQQLLRFIAAKDLGGGVCQWDYTPRISCVPVSPGDGLKLKTNAYINLGSLFDYSCLVVHECKLNPNCPNRTCDSWGANNQYIHKINDIPVRAGGLSNPNQPTGLTIIPGNKTLRITWNAVTNVEIFTYYIMVHQAGNPIKSGYTLYNERDITITGLTNGTTYTVEVSAINHNEAPGSPAIGTGTPTAPPTCPQPAMSMVIPS